MPGRAWVRRLADPAGPLRGNRMSARLVPVVVGLTAAALVAGCAVGPDFERSAPPDTTRYTREPLGAGTASAPVPGGQAQKFIQDMDIPSQWWAVFHSRELSALIERSISALSSREWNTAHHWLGMSMSWMNFCAWPPGTGADAVPAPSGSRV